MVSQYADLVPKAVYDMDSTTSGHELQSPAVGRSTTPPLPKLPFCSICRDLDLAGLDSNLGGFAKWHEITANSFSGCDCCEILKSVILGDPTGPSK
jgi:hypothetical protein